MFLTLNSKKIFVSIGFIFFLSPLFVLAQSGGVNPPSSGTGPTGIVYECTGSAPGECNFYDLIKAVKRITDFGAYIALAFSVVVIAYAGFNYMISGSVPSKRAEANKMLLSVVKGIIFILLAWVIVRLITGAILNPSINIFLN